MDDWSYCVQALREVSRTFSRPIELLSDSLRPPVTCAYLLCRIADTVEDDAALDATGREDLFRRLLAVLEDDADVSTFTEAYRATVPAENGPDVELTRRADVVFRVYRALPAAQQQACTPWIAEMTRGMAIYGRRPLGEDGLVALLTLSDLERYCYFVAGTVGRLLTHLFLLELPGLEPERARVLHREAEEFGLGLQLTNILKDITDDRHRRVSYIPRDACAEAGISVAQMTDPAHRAAAHRALAPIFERAARALDGAFAYTLAIPPSATHIRLFCLLPVWMAIRTLVLARGNDAQLIAGRPVKISRPEVECLIQECMTLHADDDGLRRRWAELSP